MDEWCGATRVNQNTAQCVYRMEHETEMTVPRIIPFTPINSSHYHENLSRTEELARASSGCSNGMASKCNFENETSSTDSKLSTKRRISMQKILTTTQNSMNSVFVSPPNYSERKFQNNDFNLDLAQDPPSPMASSSMKQKSSARDDLITKINSTNANFISPPPHLERKRVAIFPSFLGESCNINLDLDRDEVSSPPRMAKSSSNNSFSLPSPPKVKKHGKIQEDDEQDEDIFGSPTKQRVIRSLMPTKKVNKHKYSTFMASEHDRDVSPHKSPDSQIKSLSKNARKRRRIDQTVAATPTRSRNLNQIHSEIQLSPDKCCKSRIRTITNEWSSSEPAPQSVLSHMLHMLNKRIKKLEGKNQWKGK